MENFTLNTLVLCLATIFTSNAVASNFESKDGTVIFTAQCLDTGKVKLKLIDTEKPRNLMITSLDYLPMVSTTGIGKDTHRKGHTPFDELLLSNSFDYKDFSFGQQNGTIDISGFKSFVKACEMDHSNKEHERMLHLAKIKKEKQQKANTERTLKEQKEQQLAKEKQLANIKERKLRKEQLTQKEQKLVAVNPTWNYKGKVSIGSITANEGAFVTVDLASYKLYRQLDKSTYLFTHISKLPEFPSIVLTSDSFYREGFNGPKNLDVIHFGYSFTEYGQTIKLNEVR